jgi:hypothetical protein
MRNSPRLTVAAAVALLMVLTAPAFAETHLAVTIIGLTSPVYQGDPAAMAVRTAPGAQCAFTVTWAGQTHAMPGVQPMTAGLDGIVYWTWNIPPTMAQGMLPVTVTCAIGGQQGIATSSILVYSGDAM